MVGILLFIFAILGSIVLHEAGHFFTARWSGMKVHEFFIGFGPKVFSFRRGETEYGLKALPLGGYVKIAGMNPFEEIPEEDRDRVYKAKPAWKRAIVLVAGSTMHFIIAFVVLAITFSMFARSEPTLVVQEVAPDTAASAAGFETGDRLVGFEGDPVATWSELVALVQQRPGEEVDITVERDSREITLTPQLGAHPNNEDVGYLGVGPEVIEVKEGPVSAIKNAGKWVGVGAWQSLKSFVNLFSPSSIGRLIQTASGDRERTIEDPASLVGIGQQTSNLVNEGNWSGFLRLVAAFNIFIGVANLIPLPPLDGGHLAVLAYERIRRKEVDMTKLIPVTMTVILIMGSLFMLLLYLDIAKPLPALPQ